MCTRAPSAAGRCGAIRSDFALYFLVVSEGVVSEGGSCLEQIGAVGWHDAGPRRSENRWRGLSYHGRPLGLVSASASSHFCFGKNGRAAVGLAPTEYTRGGESLVWGVIKFTGGGGASQNEMATIKASVFNHALGNLV